MAPPDPTVTIVIPTYNRLPLLREAVASVLAQSFTDWELIVVDDGSTDGTPEYLRSMTGDRVRAVLLSHGGNVARARNAGLNVARGQYVAFLDSDDLWLPHKLEIQLEQMSRAGVRWSYARYRLIDLAGEPIPFRSGQWTEQSGWIVRAVLTNETGVSMSTLVAERTLLADYGGFDEDPAINLREDYDLVVRLSLSAETVAVRHCLANVRDHPGRSTRTEHHPFELTLSVYDKAARVLRDPDLLNIARCQRAHLCVEAAAFRFADREFGAGVRFLGRAALLRARPRDLAWAVGRGMNAALRVPIR